MRANKMSAGRQVFALCACIILCSVGQLQAQILATGETGGKGSKALLLTANGSFTESADSFSPYAQFIYGANPRTDLLVSAGTVTTLGKTQGFVAGGALFQLLKRDRFLLDVASFNLFSTPINRRDEACGVLYTTAIIASHPIRIAGNTAAIYSGITFLIPLGTVEDKLFTPPEVQVLVPIGFSINLPKKWVLYGEFDAGADLKLAGIGLLKLF